MRSEMLLRMKSGSKDEGRRGRDWIAFLYIEPMNVSPSRYQHTFADTLVQFVLLLLSRVALVVMDEASVRALALRLGTPSTVLRGGDEQHLLSLGVAIAMVHSEPEPV